MKSLSSTSIYKYRTNKTIKNESQNREAVEKSWTTDDAFNTTINIVKSSPQTKSGSINAKETEHHANWKETSAKKVQIFIDLGTENCNTAIFHRQGDNISLHEDPANMPFPDKHLDTTFVLIVQIFLGMVLVMISSKPEVDNLIACTVGLKTQKNSKDWI